MSDHHAKRFKSASRKGIAYFLDWKQMCQNAKHLYNTTNFNIRQVSPHSDNKTPQQEILYTMHQYIEAMNERQRQLIDRKAYVRAAKS
ncbi:hypothetical protein [Brevibacillus massiliensis]|uniref:hypothetical protein n=1 Tax=Brevibacillus massiliensis TaxID=1118054 RepID=UPI00036DE81A|nr:hypothetical protein [Brevibacillus massiliensis]